jgi:hypothetical protein
MRHFTLIIFAAALAAAPAAAQETNEAAVPSNIAGPEANMAANATDVATANGLTTSPPPPAVPTVEEAPGVTDATVTSNGEKAGFPWGLLGLLGLVGLIGRFRS